MSNRKFSSNIFKEHWRSYQELGLTPYPASKSEKKPIPKWKDLSAPVSDDYLEWEEKYPDHNIWVLLGNEYAIIDPDGPGAEEFIKTLNLPKCPTSVSGNKSTHRWFKVSSPIKPLKVATGDGTFIEVRTGNMGMLVPPSIHPKTKMPYKWIDGLSPWDIAFPELPMEAYEKIKGRLSKPEPRMMPVQIENNSLGSLDVERYLNEYGIKFKVKSDGTRTIYALERCLFADAHTTKDAFGDSSIIQGADGKLGYQCFHDHCSLKTWQDARQAISGNASVAPFCRGYIPPTSQTKPPTHKRGEGKSLSEILGEPDTGENYLVKPLLSRGDKGFIVSSYKIGKTLFLTQLSLCLSMGIPFLKFEIPQPAKVLYIRFELKNFRFRKRLQSMVKGLGGVHNVKVEPIFELVRGFNITDKKDFEWLLNLIEKHKAEVLLLDPLYKIATVDLKDTANAMPLIRKFDSIIEAHPDLLIVIAHHLRKQSTDDKESWDSTYGPMFFFADMDFEIRIRTKHRENPDFTFEHISNDVPVDSFMFSRDPETLLYYASNPEDDHLEEIIEYVEAKTPNIGGLKERLISSFGYSRREADDVVKRLLKNGTLTYEGKGKRGKLTIPKKPLFEPVPLV